MAKTLCTAFALLFLATPSWAILQKPARVRYETQDGVSKWYDVQVTFVTGAELNEATTSFRYQTFARYAVVFWGRSDNGGTEASVIKLTMFLVCGSEFDEGCLPFAGREKGMDQQDRTWEVCTGLFCY